MIRKVCVGVCAAALAVGGLVVSAGTASAAGPKGKTTCETPITQVIGTLAGNISISGCTDAKFAPGFGTGGGTTPMLTTSLATGGTITWLSGATTTFTTPVVTATNAKKCPGYVKGAETNPTAFKTSSVVTADTSGMKVPGKLKGAVCLSVAGDISVLKKFKIN